MRLKTVLLTALVAILPNPPNAAAEEVITNPPTEVILPRNPDAVEKNSTAYELLYSIGMITARNVKIDVPTGRGAIEANPARAAPNSKLFVDSHSKTSFVENANPPNFIHVDNTGDDGIDCDSLGAMAPTTTADMDNGKIGLRR